MMLLECGARVWGTGCWMNVGCWGGGGGYVGLVWTVRVKARVRVLLQLEP